MNTIWVLVVVRLLASNGDMVVMQQFNSRASCEVAGMWIKDNESRNLDGIKWACIESAKTPYAERKETK